MDIKTNCCIICNISIVTNVTTCGSSICSIKYEELDISKLYLDNKVSSFVKQYPDILKFIWDISHSAIKQTPKRFRPFPNYFITDFKRKTYHRGDIKDIMNTIITKEEYTSVLQIFDRTNIINICKYIDHSNDFDIIDHYDCGVYYLLRFIIISLSLTKTTIETEISTYTCNNTSKNIVFYKIKYSEFIEEKFGSNTDIQYLFHGSNKSNWHSILRNGIKNCSNSKLMSAGAAYGPGIYLSDNLATSSHYSPGGIIAIVEIQGNCNKWKKRNDVFVVTDESIIIVRYLIKVPHSINITELNKLIHNRLNKEIKRRCVVMINTQHAKNNRIIKEIKLFASMYKYIGIKKSQLKIKFQKENSTLTLIWPYKPHDKILQKSEMNKYKNNIQQEIILITMQIILLDLYPYRAPIIRIVYPKLNHAQITEHGLICDISLFGVHWSPTNKLSTLYKQIQWLIIVNSTIKSLDYYNDDYIDNYKKLVKSME